MTEKEYRALSRLSYSWVKLFLDDRMDFHEQFVLKVKKKSPDSKEMVFGLLVDTMALNKTALGERFLDAVVSKPTGQMGEFIDELYELTLEATNENGYLTRDVTDIMEDAYKNVAFDANGTQVKFKRVSFKKILAEFEGSDAWKYFRQQCQSTDKYLVDAPTKGYAQRVVDMLYTHANTRVIMGRRSGGRYTVYNQLIILFDYLGQPFKSMLDKVIIDHELKVIQPYDLKTTFFVEDFDLNYRKLRYYIQGLLYFFALCEWKQWNGVEDYEVLPMHFILAHSACRVDPLVRNMERNSMKEALHGFEYNGKWHTGLANAVEAIQWHQDTGIWTTSRSNFKRGGIVPIKTYGNYDFQRN